MVMTGGVYASTGVPPYNPMHTDQTYNQFTAPSRMPGDPGLSGGMTPDQLASQLFAALSRVGSGSGSSSLYYQLFSPQEVAQRGLGINSLQQAVLNAQNSAYGGQQGLIGAQAQQNDLFNQIASAQLGRQADQTKLKAAQDTHSAQGQFAAQGSISSEAARQQLGSAPSYLKNTQPWMAPSGVAGMGGSMGDIAYQKDQTLRDLYGQLLQQNSNYNLKNMDLYNQLLGLGVNRASLDVQQGQLGQSNDVYNRLLSGNYNTNVSPELRALMAALSQAG